MSGPSSRTIVSRATDPTRAIERADLRLDVGAEAHAYAIQPGNAASSLMIERIVSHDPEERMPPPEHGPGLGPRQVELLRQWIDAGAEYTPFWAYETPRRTPTPPPPGYLQGLVGPLDRPLRGPTLASRRDSPERRRVSRDLGAARELGSYGAATKPKRHWAITCRHLLRKRGPRMSTGCWRRPGLASAWQPGGSTWCVTQIPWAITATRTTEPGSIGTL